MNSETPGLTASQRYYQSHKAERRAYGREYYAKNKDRILAAIRKTKTQEPTLTVVEPEPNHNQVSPIGEFRGRGPRVSVREEVAVDFS
jgi:hypothetical protein